NVGHPLAAGFGTLRDSCAARPCFLVAIGESFMQSAQSGLGVSGNGEVRLISSDRHALELRVAAEMNYPDGRLRPVRGFYPWNATVHHQNEITTFQCFLGVIAKEHRVR